MNKKYNAKIGRIWAEQELENRVTNRRKKIKNFQTGHSKRGISGLENSAE